jgi:small-conductance mechanosensitive channel
MRTHHRPIECSLLTRIIALLTAVVGSNALAALKAPTGLQAATALAAVTALLVLAPAASMAQGKDAKSDAAAAEQAGPKSVEAGRIPAEIEKTQDELRRIDSRSSRQPRVELIIEEFPEKAKELRQRAKRDTERLEHAAHHRGLLYTLGGDWQARSAELGAWRGVVEERTSALAKDVQRLSEMRGRWKVTRDAAQESALSNALIERIDGLLLQIARTRKTIDATLRPLLTIQDDIAELRRTATAVAEGARNATDSVREHIFDIDRPRLWDLEFEGREPAWTQASEILRDELARTRDYLQAQADRVIAYGILTALVALLLRWLSRWESAGVPESDEEEAAPQLLYRPWAATSLLMLFGTIFYFDDGPLIMLGVSIMFLIVPIVRLLPATNLAQTGWAVYVLSAWMAVELTRQNLVPEPIFSRLILLVEAVFVAVLFTWLLRPSRIVLVGHTSRMLRAIGSGLRFVAPMAAVSLISNILGNVALAELLIHGALISLYTAFLVYVLDQLMNAAWAALLNTPEARRLRMVTRHAELIRRRGELWIRIALWLLWLHIALNGFSLRTAVYDAIWNGLNARSSVGELEIALIDFLLAGLMVWLSFVISRFVRFVLDEDVLPRAKLPRGVPFAISTMVRYVVLVIGFMLAVAASGLDTSRFALLVGALGVGIGIGLQDVVNNFVSGLILLFERPIQIGDTVEVNDMIGDVKRIGLRASTLRTFDGAEVVFPNSAFVSSHFVNWTLSDKMRRIELPVGVAYGTEPERVIEVLSVVLDAHASILSDPEPAVIFDGFGPSSLDFLIRGWTTEFDRWKGIRGEIGIQAVHALREAGISIPFPQRDLHLRTVSPEARGDEE